MSKRDNKRYNDKERSGAPKRGGKNRRDYGDFYEPGRRGTAGGARTSETGRGRNASGSTRGNNNGRPVRGSRSDASARGKAAASRGAGSGRTAAANKSNRGFDERSRTGQSAGRRSLLADLGFDDEYRMDTRSDAVVGADGLAVVAGRNPVTEALTGDRDVERVFIADGAEGSVSKIVAIAREQGVIVDFVPKEKIEAMAPGVKHQGVVAKVSEYKYAEMEDVFTRAEESGEDPFIIILDEISDPHNLGAIIRTAECAGAHGIVIPKRRSASLTQTAALSAAGAIENMPVVQVTNLARTIEELKERGVWVGAADMDGDIYYEANLTGPIAIVIGNEGKGVGRLVKEKCDFVLSIPMYGRINSLNASNAAAVLMYGIRRARTK